MEELDRPTETQEQPRNRTSGARAAAEWLADHGDYLFAYAVARVRRQDVAEDLVQETLLAAMESRERFEGRSSTRTWLTSILRHKLADHWRSSERDGPQSAVREQTLERCVEANFARSGKWNVNPRAWAVSSGPLDRLESEEFRQALLECLEKLPARPAEAIDLVERGGMNLEQVSNLLGITATHVGVILYRARLALRECLEKNWFRKE